MKIEEKIPYALKAIDFIATHDDAPKEVVDNALDAIAAHLKDVRSQIRARRNMPPLKWWKFWEK